MKRFFTLFMTLTISCAIQAQVNVGRASLDDDGQTQYHNFVSDKAVEITHDELPQASGFPVSVGSNQYYKPFRGVALADIDGVAGDEIIVSHDDTLTVVKGDGTILWAKPLTGGYAQYAPSVGDINNDGYLEIVATAMYANSYGGINVFDKDGNQLSGFPVQTDNNPVMCASALADINNDGFLEIIWNGKGRSSQNVAAGIHVWNYLGEEIDGFPFEMPSTPATTPTVADIDNDGNLEVFVTTTTALYAFNNQGVLLQNYPVETGDKYSYQSPLVVDLDGNGDYSLVGSCHGDSYPQHYVRDAVSGEYRPNWPKTIDNWTYSSPTVVDLTGDGDYTILAGVAAQAPANVIYRYDTEANIVAGFPINRGTGAEGIISVADIDGDGDYEFMTDSNGTEELNGANRGFIYAYEMDGTEITTGFPLRPEGYTFMNGANIGDVMGDGNMYLVALSYVNTFQPTDPLYINVYPLNQPIENLAFGTYKGDNTRCGFISGEETVSCNPPQNLINVPGDEKESFVSLLWEAPEDGSTGLLSGYNVYRDGSVVNSELITELNYIDYDVEPSTTYEYVVSSVFDDGCEALSEAITASSWTVGVSEKQDQVLIYPNPASSQCRIVSNLPITVLKMFNAQGQLVKEMKVNGSREIQIPIQEPAGLYIIKVCSQDGESMVRLSIE